MHTVLRLAQSSHGVQVKTYTICNICFVPSLHTVQADGTFNGEAGLQTFRFHDLRHTAASYLLMSGANLVELADILGHRTMQMVKRYAHFTQGHTRGVLTRMAQQFLA